MQTLLQLAATCLTTIALSTALAHALELPGKMRLDRDAYAATQTIYYPGFTIVGVAEPFAIIAVAALAFLTSNTEAAFGWTLAALAALILMHAAYWIITHPVNKFWLKDENLQDIGKGFFSIGSPGPDRDAKGDPETVWRSYRDRWERSHVVRAVFAATAFFSLLMTLIH